MKPSKIEANGALAAAVKRLPILPFPIGRHQADAMPGEGYGDGSAPDGTWVPDETAIDPYVLQQPAYPDSSSTSGDGAWDPFTGSSLHPYTPPEEAASEEAPVTEGEDPNALGSF